VGIGELVGVVRVIEGRGVTCIDVGSGTTAGELTLGEFFVRKIYDVIAPAKKIITVIITIFVCIDI